MTLKPARRAGGRTSAAELVVHVRRTTRAGRTPASTQLRHWARLALGARGRSAELSLLVVGPARSRSLNRRYRGRDYATNVLSFPAAAAPVAAGASAVGTGRLLGDIVICPQVLRREARAQGKAERAHFMHLYIHGVLHLIGFDHQRPAAARRMEQRETRLLRALGVANPYRS